MAEGTATYCTLTGTDWAGACAGSTMVAGAVAGGGGGGGGGGDTATVAVTAPVIANLVITPEAA
ncbi:MAG: hypothetical protein Q7V88_11105, partial [Actinomycetota bacterium]|nr:hypothetical protein [Actinomycetota bacterium]